MQGSASKNWRACSAASKSAPKRARRPSACCATPRRPGLHPDVNQSVGAPHGRDGGLPGKALSRPWGAPTAAMRSALLADVQHQRVFLELVAVLLRDFLLQLFDLGALELEDRKSTRLNSSH